MYLNAANYQANDISKRFKKMVMQSTKALKQQPRSIKITDYQKYNEKHNKHIFQFDSNK